MVFIGIIGLTIVLLAAGFLATAYAPVSADDVAALHMLSGLPGPSARIDRLFAAYLSRARRYRTGWSVVAWVSALVLAVGLSIGGGNGLGDPTWAMVLLGFSGYLLGAIVAELHHLRRPKQGVRTASLRPRSLRDFMSARQRWFLRSLALLAIALTGTGIVVQTTQHDVYQNVGNGPRFLVARAESYWISLVVLGTVAVGLWFVIELVQRAIVQRPRPALPDDLAAGDDAIRKASLSTVALGGSGLVALIVCTEAGIVGSHVRGNGSIPCAVAALASFGLAIQLMFRTRRVAWPRRKLEKDGGLF